MSLESTRIASLISHAKAFELQEQIVKDILNDQSPERVLYLEHEPIYTIGRTRDTSSLQNKEQLPHPSIEINRGGQATYHGPGQLVGYLLLDLRKRQKDLHQHIRLIEQALIDCCQSLGINAQPRQDFTGVWIGHSKVASIGVGVRKWISMHGFAINVTKQSLKGFESITPCGIDGVNITYLNEHLPSPITVDLFAQQCHTHIKELFDLT